MQSALVGIRASVISKPLPFLITTLLIFDPPFESNVIVYVFALQIAYKATVALSVEDKFLTDCLFVYVALVDWTAPLEIRTNPKNRNLFDRHADYVIAYGSVETGKTIEDWTEFSIELDYRDTYRVPSYILIVSSASKYGDYFTGGAGSRLMIDDFSLEWDYY